MKKRIFLIVSSILCALLTLSLVIYTIVVSTNGTTGGNNNGNGTDVIPVNYVKGSGTKEDPYKITRVSDLMDLIKDHNNADTYFEQAGDLDLSDYASFEPIGNCKNPFKANFNGNGYSIKNMKVVITKDNLAKYVEEDVVLSDGSSANVMLIGFFGYVSGSGDAVNTVKNVKIENASINTEAIDEKSVRNTITLDQVYAGTLAGIVLNSKVENCSASATINSSLNCDRANYTAGIVAGLIGYACDATVNNCSANVKFVAKNFGSTFKVEDDIKVYGDFGYNFAGLVGVVQNTNITTATVSMEAEVRNYPYTRISGIAYYVSEKSVISNVNVKKFIVDVIREVVDSTLCIRVSGACDYLGSEAQLNNCTVAGAQVKGTGTCQVAGLVNLNYGAINNSYVSGNFSGSIVGGACYLNNGAIYYSNSAKATAVDVVIDAQLYGAGLVVENYGYICGANSLTTIRAIISWIPVDVYFNDFDIMDDYMLSGVVVNNYGATIENLRTITNILDCVNGAGVIGYAKAGNNANVLKNVQVNVVFRTLKVQEGKNYSGQTTVIGGVIGYADYKTELTEVCGYITVNYKDKLANGAKYSLKYFGGIVGLLNAEVNCAKTTSSSKNWFDIEVYSNYLTDNYRVDKFYGAYTSTGFMYNTSSLKFTYSPELVK